MASKKKNEAILGVGRRFLSYQKAGQSQTAPSKNEAKNEGKRETTGKLRSLEKSLSLQNRSCEETAGKIEFLKCSVSSSNKMNQKNEVGEKPQEESVRESLREKNIAIVKSGEPREDSLQEDTMKSPLEETQFTQKSDSNQGENKSSEQASFSQNDERFIHQLEKEIDFLKSQIEIKDQQLATKDDLIVNFQVLLKSAQEKVLLLEDSQKEKDIVEKTAEKKQEEKIQKKKSWFSKWFA